MIRKAFSRFKSAKQAARKENTEASPPNEDGSKTADEERSNTADEEESKAAHGASLTAADDAETIRQKEKPPCQKTWRL